MPSVTPQHDRHISSSAYSRHTHQTAAPLTVSKVVFTPYNINAEQVQLCKACQLQDARQAGNAELAKAQFCRQLPKTHMLVAELLYKYRCWQTATSSLPAACHQQHYLYRGHTWIMGMAKAEWVPLMS